MKHCKTRALSEHKLRQGLCIVALWWVSICHIKCSMRTHAP